MKRPGTLCSVAPVLENQTGTPLVDVGRGQSSFGLLKLSVVAFGASKIRDLMPESVAIGALVIPRGALVAREPGAAFAALVNGYGLFFIAEGGAALGAFDLQRRKFDVHRKSRRHHMFAAGTLPKPFHQPNSQIREACPKLADERQLWLTFLQQPRRSTISEMHLLEFRSISQFFDARLTNVGN